MPINLRQGHLPSQVVLSNSRKKGRTVKLEESGSHRNWALQKIKQAVSRKRGESRASPAEPECSDGEMLISELERMESRSKEKQEDLARNLRRLKKYRRYIQLHERQ